MSTHFVEDSTTLLTNSSTDGYTRDGNYGIHGNDMTQNRFNHVGAIEYPEYIYEAFAFERPIYLYIWEIIVIIMALFNVLVIIVLLRKEIRNPTYLILAAIAISDTLTGLVTLPSYIMVYQNLAEAPDNTDHMHGHMHGVINETDIHPNMHDMGHTERVNMSYNHTTNHIMPIALDGYILTKSLCQWFMLSKFFLSQLFHTCSIFLTLFLAIQRYVSVAYPLHASKIFTGRTVLKTCVCIFILSPLIHIYHVLKEKAKDGLCQWEINSCKEECPYLWAVFFIRHFIPGALLSIFTILFIIELRKTRLVGGNREQIARRESVNRRITIIVISIVIVFLVPEIPFDVYLLMTAIYKHTRTPISLKTSRMIHAVYEIALVVSFHANFYIYTFLKDRFRSGLKRTVMFPIRRVRGIPYRWSVRAGGRDSNQLNFRKNAQSSVVPKLASLQLPKDGRYVGTEANQVSPTDTIETTFTNPAFGSVDDCQWTKM